MKLFASLAPEHVRRSAERSIYGTDFSAKITSGPSWWWRSLNRWKIEAPDSWQIGELRFGALYEKTAHFLEHTGKFFTTSGKDFTTL